MFIAVRVFEVHEYGIHPLQGGLQRLPVEESAGLYGQIVSFIVEDARQLVQESGLGCRLSPAEGHPASGEPVEDGLAVYFLYDVLRFHVVDHGVVLGLALGVGAPGTAERAAGHEYYRPYAAAVVDRHVLQLHDEAAHLDGVLRAGDDGVLHALGQVYELGRVAGYADQQVLVILRMLLSGSQSLGFYAVELDVEGSQGE